MKLFVIAAVLLAAVSAQSFSRVDLQAPVLDDELIDSINARPNHSWKAGRNSFFEGKTVGDVVAMLGALSEDNGEADEVVDVVVPNGIPDEFDGRLADEWHQCVHPIRDQGHCGSCWAFSRAESLTDRYCIATEGEIDVIMSPQHLVSCSKMDLGCNGGRGGSSGSFIVKHGLVSDDCYNYLAENQKCPKFEKDGCPDSDEEPVFYKASKHYKVKGAEKIKADLYENGPQWFAFKVYQDFIAYTEGVYQHTEGSMLGGHAVKSVGYGHDEESGLDYWLIANSWSPAWGEDGYFRMVRGTNDCGIEGDVRGLTIPN